MGKFTTTSAEFGRENQSIIVRLAFVVAFYLVGIAFYHNVEGWSKTNCAFFVTVSVTVSKARSEEPYLNTS